MRKPGPARSVAPGWIDADERQHDSGPQRTDRVDQVVDAFVAARRPEKHHDLAGVQPLAGTRRGAIVARRVPCLRVPRVRQERSAEAPLEKSRRDRDCVGATHEPLGHPRPCEPVRIREVEGATDSAPGARAAEEPDLPVVDVEQKRPPPAPAREQSQPEAGRPRLGRDENLAIDQLEKLGHTAREAGAARGLHRAIRDRAVARRHPAPLAELRPDHGDLVARGEKTGEQVRPTGRVVRQVGGDDRDPHAAPALTRRS